MLWILAVLVVLATAFALISMFHLRGEDLSRFDSPAGQIFPPRDDPGGERDAVVAALASGLTSIQEAPRRQRLVLMREYLDNLSAGLDLAAAFTDVDAGGVPAEWVVAPGVSGDAVLVSLHGGAFSVGSLVTNRRLAALLDQRRRRRQQALAHGRGLRLAEPSLDR